MEAEIVISVIKSLTSGLRESEDKFSPFAKLDQMPFGALCLNILEATDTNESGNQRSELHLPVVGLAPSKGTTGMLCGSRLTEDEPCPPPVIQSSIRVSARPPTPFLFP